MLFYSVTCMQKQSEDKNWNKIGAWHLRATKVGQLLQIVQQCHILNTKALYSRPGFFHILLWYSYKSWNHENIKLAKCTNISRLSDAEVKRASVRRTNCCHPLLSTNINQTPTPSTFYCTSAECIKASLYHNKTTVKTFLCKNEVFLWL